MDLSYIVSQFMINEITSLARVEKSIVTERNSKCISFDISPELIQAIKAIPLRIASSKEDIIFWASSPCGEFDSKNAYNIAKNLGSHPNQFNGSRIWEHSS